MREIGECVEHHASADSHDRRKLPHNEAVPGQQKGGLSQAQLGHGGFSRRNAFVQFLAEEHDRGDGFKSVSVQMDPRPVFQGLCRRQ